MDEHTTGWDDFSRSAWTGEGWMQPAAPGALEQAFGDWAPPVGPLARAAGPAIEWGLFAHGRLPRWHDGRTALLGDACHPMLPFLAQGASMAIEDAWVLAACLDRTSDIAAALASYQRARLRRTARVQAAAARNAGIYHLRGAPLRTARNAALAAASALPGGLLARFDWLYGADVTGA